jgi:kynurenine formamidase
VTVGEDSHWYGGFTAAENLGDFGPQRADASTLLPIFTRGVMLDMARVAGSTALAAGAAIERADLERAAELEGISVGAGDVVLLRTGYLHHWPDRSALAEHSGAGITLDAARWLAEQGVIAVGADTEAVEQMPTVDSGNPQPVHSYLLVEKGILLLEMVYLEGLATDSVYSFLFVAQPTKIQGASGAFIDPIAVV